MKKKHIGYFDSEDAAFSAYKEEKERLHLFNPEVVMRSDARVR